MDLTDIVVFDSETTGTNPEDENTRAVQLAFVRCSDEHHTNGSQMPHTTSSYILQSDDVLSFMGPETIGYHGITPSIIKKYGVEPRTFLKGIIEKIDKEDIVAGHNVSFDLQILNRELKKNQIVSTLDENPQIDTLRLVKEWYSVGEYDRENKTLPNFKLATCFYGILPEDWWDLEEGKAHSAETDAVMCSKLIEYWNLIEGHSIEEMVTISESIYLQKICMFGSKYKGIPWDEVPNSYLTWMWQNNVWNGDFGEDEELEYAIAYQLNERGYLEE
jgi:DNA polymerase III epsilon subunit-like protein